MKSREGYKGYVIVARSCELQDGGFAAEFSVEEHDADGVMETEFYLPDTFPTQESAVEAAIQAGRQKIDAGFERGSAVVNGLGKKGRHFRPDGQPDEVPTCKCLQVVCSPYEPM